MTRSTRYEVPYPTEYSWREGAVTQRAYLGPHSVDQAWPWWRPWTPWEARGQ